jgi:phytoene dehydrogenase-like protein
VHLHPRVLRSSNRHYDRVRTLRKAFAGATGGPASQMLLGPRPGHSPYATGLTGTYLCSAATPPGPGAHGMCGANAATLALQRLSR